MASQPVVGVYNSIARARLAQEALIEEGVPEEHVAISIDLTDDGIAAEVPGQSFVNQPTDGAADGWFGSRWRTDARNERSAGYIDATRSGACVVTAEARDAEEADRIQQVMAALRAIHIKVPAS